MPRVIKGGLATALAVVGLVAFATPAFAHDDNITASASCSSPLGTGFTITWTIGNNFNLAETGSVTSVTYGLSTLSSTTYSIANSPGTPYQSTTLTQTLPATATGAITMDISSTWTDGLTRTDTSTVSLSESCAAPTQTIAGHIYLCDDGNPTTIEESGGTVAASGPTTVPVTANPLAPTSVVAGGYTMTATNPTGYTLVACGGSSSPNPAGTSATEPVTVPSGGAGVGVFYVVALVTSPAVTSPGTSTIAPTTPAPSTTANTTQPQTLSAATPAIAFTGAMLSQEWAVGAAAVLLGMGLMVMARYRRRKPRHAAK